MLLVADSGHWSPDNAYETDGTSYRFHEQIPWWAAVPAVGECSTLRLTEALPRELQEQHHDECTAG
jgi:hypothetical protein